MLSRFFGKKPSVEELQNQLAQARRLLWNDDIAEAEKQFNQVVSNLKNVDKLALSSDLEAMTVQTRLGLWAINYIRDGNRRGEFRQIVEGVKLDAETAFFIAKMFQIKKDFISSDALFAYKSLLRLKPDPNLAQRIGEALLDIQPATESVELLETIIYIMGNHLSYKVQLLRWYLKLGAQQKAQDIARQILAAEPNNRDAHRCLGYIAEISGDWKTAFKHYVLSLDWLRAGVVAFKADRIVDAIHALDQLGVDEQENPTYLYYRGWIAFRQGNLETADKAWRQLQLRHPSNTVNSLIQALDEHLTYKRLQEFNIGEVDNSERSISSAYQEVWGLATGAFRLVVDGDINGSKPLLQKAAEAQRTDLRAVTYFALCTTLEHANASEDAVYAFLLKQIGDASLFMWLRGLALLKSGQPGAHLLLKKAYEEGVFDRHLPIQAGTAGNWLVTRLTGERIAAPIPTIDSAELKAALAGNSPFIGSIVSSRLLDLAKAGGEQAWLLDMNVDIAPDKAWDEVLSAIFASQNLWSQALKYSDSVEDSLRKRMFEHAVIHAVNKRKWQSASEFITQGLAIWPQDTKLQNWRTRLRPFIRHHMWKTGQFEALDYDLEKQILSGPVSTADYHDLALIYTQIALKRDDAAAKGADFSLAEHRTQSPYIGVLEDQAHNDYWQLAIGYWAITLSDKDYWRNWIDQRTKIYCEPISARQLHELIELRIPSLIRNYHKEQINAGSKYAVHHRYYGALITREIELTAALRHLIRAAEANRISLPTEIGRYISPLLIKEYGFEQIARTAITSISSLRLSPYEAGLIQEAFAPTSDVKALIEAKDYSTAVDRLSWLLNEVTYVAYHDEIQRELFRVIQLAAAHMIDDEKWDEAYNLIIRGLEINAINPELHDLLVKAGIGWAGDKVREGIYAAAIRRIEHIQQKIPYSPAQLNLYLSEIYVEWALEAINEDDLSLAIVRLQKAIAAYNTNNRAREIINMAYNDLAVEKAQAGHFQAALNDAEAALYYVETSRSLVLITMINRSLAVEATERSNVRLADTHWLRAREVSNRNVTIANTLESLNLYVEITIAHAIFLYNRQLLDAALQIAEPLVQLSYDRNAIEVNLPLFLSEICTNMGANFYNAGNRVAAAQYTQKALTYDPQNQVAIGNLRLLGIYQPFIRPEPIQYEYEMDEDEDEFYDYDDDDY